MSEHDNSTLVSSGIIDCVQVFSSSFPSFVLPIVRTSSGSNVSYLQSTDTAGSVCGFELYSSRFNLRNIASSRSVSIGDKEIFGLVDPSDQVLVGNRTEISRHIKTWLYDIEDSLSKVSFAQFCNEKAVFEIAAKKIFNQKREEFNSEELASSWFVHALIARDLIGILTNGGKSLGAVSLSSMELPVRVEGASIIILLPPRLLERGDRKQYRARLARLLDSVRVATGRSVSLQRSNEVAGEPQDNDVEKRARKIVEGAASYKKQEQRLTHLIRSLLVDVPAGKLALKIYNDRASYAKMAVPFLSSRVSSASNSEEVEWAIGRSVPSLVSRAWPHQKGLLLFCLAEQLRAYPRIAQAIKAYIEKSGSHFILQYSGEIGKMLS